MAGSAPVDGFAERGASDGGSVFAGAARHLSENLRRRHVGW